MKKFTLLFIATLFSALSFAAVPRVMAYDLKSEMDTPAKGFTKFTFSTNTKPTKAYLIFYHAGSEVFRKDITTQAQKQLKNASYTIRTSDLPELTNMKWAIEVQDNKINSLACVNDVNNVGTYGFNRPQGVAVDNNPESDFFGRTYISLPKAGGSSSTYGAYGDTKAGIVVFDAVHNRLSSGITATGSVLDDETYGVHRVAVNPVNGKVYYTKSIASNTAVYELTPDATDILKDGGTAVDVVSGLGLTRADGVCFAEDGTMFVVDYARYSGGTQGDIYKVKGNSKTLFCENIAANQPNSLAYDGKGGIWMVQQRGAAGSDPSPLVHINASGTADFKLSTNINNWFPTANATKGGSVAYNTKDNVLALGGAGVVMLFQVKIVDGKPTLDSKIGEYTIKAGGTAEINGLAFDYAGNLVVMSRTTERMHYLVVPTTTNSCTTPAKSSLQVNGPATCRVMPHDLTLVDNGDSYTFSYKTNVYAQSGNLVIFKEDGKTVEKTFALPTPIVKNKTHQITIAKTDLPKRIGMNWGIELTGKAVPKYSYLQEVSDQTREIYDFYNMMGVLVDNNPESDYFGKIYVQATLNGKSDGATTRADNQKAGLFIYNQWLDELNPTSNVGIQPSLPSGYSIGSANQFNRLAIDPTTNNITYCYAVSGQPAVFSMNRANLTGTPANLLEGQSGITRSVAHCFDADGNLYVMDLPGKGQIFKIDKEGNKITFGELTSKYVAVNMALASDGHGGLWVAQNRGQIDTYYQLVHYNKSGDVDYAIYQGSDHGFTGSSTRGALAYDVERQVLAQGRNGSVILFDVTYDASTGVPTLTQQSLVASIGHNNIDGLAFDYAGDLYVVNSGKEKFYKFTIPTNNNTCLVPAKKALTVDGNVVAYELNGGQWNKYGWTSKKDMYDAFVADWKEYSNSVQYFCPYETQLGIGNSNKGLPTAILGTQDILGFMAQEKWAWLGEFLDALATAQDKATMPTAATTQMRFALGNFFGEDNNNASNWVGAVDCSAGQADAEEFQPMWGCILSNPTQPITTVVLGDPYRKGYRFDGWYTSATFSGSAVTIVDENTDGTLYAKWIEHFHTREVPAGYYATVCLAYNLIDLDGATLYEVAGKENGKIYLDEVPASETEAGKPYIYLAEADAQVFYYGTDETTLAGNHKSLHGTFVKLEDADLDGMYMLQNNKVIKCAATGCWIDPYRAYFNGDELNALGKPGAQMPGRRRVSLGANEENATTGSEDIVTPNEQVIKVIENGQVIIIRDGVKYNLQGVRL